MTSDHSALTTALIKQSTPFLAMLSTEWTSADPAFMTRLAFNLKTLGFNWKSNEDFGIILGRATRLGLVELRETADGTQIKRGLYVHQVMEAAHGLQ